MTFLSSHQHNSLIKENDRGNFDLIKLKERTRLFSQTLGGNIFTTLENLKLLFTFPKDIPSPTIQKFNFTDDVINNS